MTAVARRRLVVAAALICLVPGDARAAQGPLEKRRAESAQFLREGARYLRDGRAPEAARWLRQAVRLDPASAPGRTELALAYVGAGNEPAAREALAAAGHIVRHDPDARGRLAARLETFPAALRAAAGLSSPPPPRPKLSENAAAVTRSLTAGRTPPARREAARLLAGVPGVTSILARALRREKHGSVRREILAALGAANDPTVWPYLAAHLEGSRAHGEPDALARAAAAAGLGKLSGPARAAVPILIRVLRSDRHPAPATAAARALGRLTAPGGGEPSSKTRARAAAVETALWGGLKHPSGRVRSACVEALGLLAAITVEATSERDVLIARLLTDSDSAVAEAGLRGLVRRRDLAGHMPKVVELLGERVPHVQAAAAGALCRWAALMLGREDAATPVPPDGVLARLRSLATAADIEIRIEATAALAIFQDDPQEREKNLAAWAGESRIIGVDAGGAPRTAGNLARERLHALQVISPR